MTNLIPAPISFDEFFAQANVFMQPNRLYVVYWGVTELGGWANIRSVPGVTEGQARQFPEETSSLPHNKRDAAWVIYQTEILGIPSEEAAPHYNP